MSRETDKPATIRKACSDDIDGIMRIEEACFTNPGEKFHRRQVLGLVANPRGSVLVAEGEGGQILGWVAGLLRRAGAGASGRAYSLAVAPEARGLGLGRKLLERTLADLAAGGAGTIFLEVREGNEAAIGLYRSLGFEEVRRLPDYYGRGLHGVRMRLKPVEESKRIT
jgi:[ribosomal protein S18]-alanine N-acetyltransferase